MGDRTWAQFVCYQVGRKREVEAICMFLDEHFPPDFSSTLTRTPAVVLGEDYSDDSTSLGLLGEAPGLAEVTPNSVWTMYQSGYDGPGQYACHIPGHGLWVCDNHDGSPLFTEVEVRKIVATPSVIDRQRLMGVAWDQAITGFEAWIHTVDESLRTVKRPKVK